MPWMIFYQQSAVADKKLRPAHYRYARWDTAIGSVITQAVMAAVLIAAAATVGRHSTGASLNSVGDITRVLVPVLGEHVAAWCSASAPSVRRWWPPSWWSLASAWGFGEVSGYRHSLEHHPLEAPWFYGIYTAAVIGGAIIVAIAQIWSS